MQQVKAKDQYGRNVAACAIAPDLPFQQPEDMGEFLVRNGLAVAYRCALSAHTSMLRVVVCV
jgi:endonuclease YncB( thermonuclease family)